MGRAAHRAQRRASTSTSSAPPAATPTTRAPAASPATRAASTRSSGRCTWARRWPGGSTELQASLSAYGDPLGEAFQLRDDLLGAFGDEAATGKPVGDDLREGKPTPLLAVATANADAIQAGVLADIGRPDLDDGGVERIQDVLVETGALKEIEASIDALTSEAIAAIKVADITDEARGASSTWPSSWPGASPERSASSAASGSSSATIWVTSTLAAVMRPRQTRRSSAPRFTLAASTSTSTASSSISSRIASSSARASA